MMRSVGIVREIIADCVFDAQVTSAKLHSAIGCFDRHYF